MRLSCFLLLFAFMPASAQVVSPAPNTQVLRLDPALDTLIAPDAHLDLVASGFVFTEGPMWRQGRLWFSDEEGGKTVAVTPDGHVTVLVDYNRAPYAPSAGGRLGPNAIATAPDGSVILCEQYARAVEKLIGDPSHLSLVPYFDSYQGKRLNSPNDLVFASDGSFFFTDPPYGLKAREHDPAKQLPFDAVFHYKHGKLTPIITDLILPNGIGISPDGHTLYVNNSGPDPRLIAYPLHADGTVGTPVNLMTFTGHEGPGVPDGLKLDTFGNIWTTGPGGIRILTPQGKLLGQLTFPVTAANLAWGEDGHTLYITATGSIYKLHTLVQGLMPRYSR